MIEECVQHFYRQILVLKHTDTCMQVRGKREFGFCVNGQKKVEIRDNGRVARIVLYLFLIAINENALQNKLILFLKVVDLFDV